MSKTIIVLSDMHTGHTRGLNPSHSISKNKSNPFQTFVLKSFFDFRDRYKNPDYLILNGDICDGSQAINLGVEAVTTNTDEQVNLAIELIEPIIGKRTQVYGVNGSGYHNSARAGASLDRQVIEKLGGKYHSNLCELSINDMEKIQFKHNAGYTIPSIYKEMKNIINDSVKSKTKCPTMLIRSHGHTYLKVEEAGISITVTPCWQYLTDFMEKKSFKGTPDIGGYVIIYDDRNKILSGYAHLYSIPPEIIDKMRNVMSLTDKAIRDKKKLDSIEREKYHNEYSKRLINKN